MCCARSENIISRLLTQGNCLGFSVDPCRTFSPVRSASPSCSRFLWHGTGQSEMSVLPERPRCDGLLDVKVIDDNEALKSVTWLSKERKVFLEASKKTVDNMQFSVTCAERESVHLEGISQSTSLLSDALDGIRMLWSIRFEVSWNVVPRSYGKKLEVALVPRTNAPLVVLFQVSPNHMRLHDMLADLGYPIFSSTSKTSNARSRIAAIS